jgi:hypothetical protein
MIRPREEFTTSIKKMSELSTVMVVSMFLVNAQQGYALLDPRATHSFMSYKLLTN